MKWEITMKFSRKLNLPMHSANVDKCKKVAVGLQIKPQLKTRCLQLLGNADFKQMIAFYIPAGVASPTVV